MRLIPSALVVALLSNGAIAFPADLHDPAGRAQSVAKYAAADSSPERRPAPIEGATCATLDTAAGSDKYCVSSVLSTDRINRYDYGPASLFDNALDTAWVEGVPGQGIGEWIVVEFDKRRLVTGIDINNGYNKDLDLYEKNSRARDIKVEFSGRERSTWP